MSGSWLPVLLVLGFGLVTGLVAAWRLRAESGLSVEAADLALRKADLERRRDSLYYQIRSSTNPRDRQRLELSAAHVLRELDDLAGGSGVAAAPAGRMATQADAMVMPETAPPVAAPARSGARAMVVGFVSGAALVALVGVLIYWAVRDAKPRPDAETTTSASMPAGDHPAAPLPPEVQAEIDTLRARLAADPSDLLARKQLALALLSAESFVEAFEIAEQILAAYPEDPDGLYIQGMVRLTMGQDEAALGLLDRVVAQYPNHVMALAGRGMIFFRRGDAEAAILTWERALAAAGGRHPDIERLLALARSAETPPPGASAASQQIEPPPSNPPPQSVPADSFGVVIELSPGARVLSTATLFVFLRAEEQGPPAAVKRLQGPTFPVRLTLGPTDTMMGQPLPSSGIISVRLDADGSASTREAGDLSAETEASLGATVRLVLGP